MKVALDYPFDVLFIQTYGDAELFNAVLPRCNAYYFPFAYNERRFYPRVTDKFIDIGMYFKVERHPQRIEFIRRVMESAMKYRWKCELSNAYWGEAYA